MTSSVETIYYNVRDGALEVMALVELAGQHFVVDLCKPDGTKLTVDEQHAIEYLIFRGRLHLHHSIRNVYEVRP